MGVLFEVMLFFFASVPQTTFSIVEKTMDFLKKMEIGMISNKVRGSVTILVHSCVVCFVNSENCTDCTLY